MAEVAVGIVIVVRIWISPFKRAIADCHSSLRSTLVRLHSVIEVERKEGVWCSGIVALSILIDARRNSVRLEAHAFLALIYLEFCLTVPKAAVLVG